METILLVVHLLVAIFLVSVILMQRSSGGALDGLGGGSGANSILSARGTGNFLTKVTAILATLFFITSLSLSLLYKNAEPKAGSILETAPVTQAVPDAQEAPSAPVAAE